MKKKYIQPIVDEVQIELQNLMAESKEGYDSGGDGAGTGGDGPPAPGKDILDVWEEDDDSEKQD